MEIKEKKFNIREIEFDIKYVLKCHESNSDTKYFPTIISVEHKKINLKDLLDNSILDEMRVLIYKENNNISA